MKRGINISDSEISRNKVISYMCKMYSKENIPCYEQCYHKSRGIKMPETKLENYKKIYEEIKNDYYLYNEKTTLIKSEHTDKIVKKIKKEKWKKR